MAKSDQFTCRLAVGTRDGPRSATWRIWAARNDVYITARSIGGQAKVAIHASGERHLGLTEQFAGQVGKVKERHSDRWFGGLAFPGGTIEFRVFVPTSELRIFADKDAAKFMWVAPAPLGQQTEIALALGTGAKPELWPKSDRYEGHLLTSGRLKDGRAIWIVYHYTPQPPPDEIARTRVLLQEGFRRLISERPAALKPSYRIYAAISGEDGVRAYVDLSPEFVFGTDEDPLL
jgi:hypothetical protein